MHYVGTTKTRGILHCVTRFFRSGLYALGALTFVCMSVVYFSYEDGDGKALVSSTQTGPVPSVIELPVIKDNEVHTKENYSPPNILKVWLTDYKGRTYRVVQLPRSPSIETIITYHPQGETLEQAKTRMGGCAVMTGSFHHPRSMALADFLQRDGRVLSALKTKRPYLAIYPDGRLAIATDYTLIRRVPGVSALALGQSLVPLGYDGFSRAFMARHTDRCAIGMNEYFIFLVFGKSDIWTLAEFMGRVLPCDIAVNSDGGHVVRGRAPVHVVFRWKN